MFIRSNITIAPTLPKAARPICASKPWFRIEIGTIYSIDIYPTCGTWQFIYCTYISTRPEAKGVHNHMCTTTTCTPLRLSDHWDAMFWKFSIRVSAAALTMVEKHSGFNGWVIMIWSISQAWSCSKCFKSIITSFHITSQNLLYIINSNWHEILFLRTTRSFSTSTAYAKRVMQYKVLQ